MKKRKDPLEGLIESANPDILGKLIKELASGRPEIRRECFEFLKGHVTLDQHEDSVSEAETMFALWWELEPDLKDAKEHEDPERIDLELDSESESATYYFDYVYEHGEHPR